MPNKRQLTEYEPVRRSQRASPQRSAAVEAAWMPPAGSAADGIAAPRVTQQRSSVPRARQTAAAKRTEWVLRHGHTFTYAGIFLFTVVLYFRPYEFLPLPHTLAFWLAILTLIIFVPAQLAVEGTLTARPREVNLVLLLCLAALLSIPLAVSRGEALDTFVDPFLKAVVIFIVIVNVVRTEWRLQGLFFLTLAVSCVLSFAALNDFRQGRFSVEGYRIAGSIGGMFGNPNEMALHLITVVPIAVALFLSTRGLIGKMVYGSCAMLLVAGSMVTYSRGAFLGLAGGAAVLMWKLGRRRLGVIVLMVVAGTLFLAFAPGGYGSRMLSIFDSSLDPSGSSNARQALFWRSLHVAIANPVFGVGIGNFHILSIREQVTHNTYTQVAAEMGFAALVVYTMFIVTPLRRLRQIERETFMARRESRFYYLSIGLQASLVAYMISSFFSSAAYLWYVYYLVGYAVALRRMYEAQSMKNNASTGDGGDQRDANKTGESTGRSAAPEGMTSPTNDRGPQKRIEGLVTA